MANEEQTKGMIEMPDSPTVNALLIHLKKWYGDIGGSLRKVMYKDEESSQELEEVQEPEENEPVEEKEPPSEDVA